MRVGILALQGDVREHARSVEAIGATPVELRTPGTLGELDALILPGGESTTLSKLLDLSGLRSELRRWIDDDRPTLGTCAGLVLLASTLHGGRDDQSGFAAIAIAVERNGFGRQRSSFEAPVNAPTLGGELLGVFIRAPRIVEVGDGVEVLATLEAEDGSSEPVAVQQGRLLACSFHPELADEPSMHHYLVSLAEA